ncbi:hypothetical protein TIFTF001_024219 [Ficus carica]|uniref:Uncharacterized protein n=1 Tax=Ficus carica TaxID=3494 RepID=A0AA88AMZ2_FICCA|nr:hypothetical protein TIFTF001_024219 [Ficus carica]
MKVQEKLWRMRARHKLLQGQIEKDYMINITIQGREILFAGFGFGNGIVMINPILVGTGSC